AALEFGLAVLERCRSVAHQHAVLAEHAEELTRGRGQELLQYAVVQRRPLGVRAGQADELPPFGERAYERERAQELRLLAAHDVGRAERIRAAHAGHEVDSRARRTGLVGELGEVRRAG